MRRPNVMLTSNCGDEWHTPKLPDDSVLSMLRHDIFLASQGQLRASVADKDRTFHDGAIELV